MDYKARLYRHLSDYRTSTLGLDKDDCGVWKKDGLRRPWILPEDGKWLNLVDSDTYRPLVERWLAMHPDVELHRDFHHLNSSQAMCWSLFFPLLCEPRRHALLMTALGLQDQTVADWHLEKVFPKRDNEPEIEATNFDLWVLTTKGRHLFFECKLSEAEFGTQRNKPSVETKRTDIYAKRLAGLVPPRYLEAPLFHRNYQIIRNLSYLPLHPGSQVFFIYPRANEHLEAKREAIKEICSEGLAGRAEIVPLEAIVAELARLTGAEPSLSAYYDRFGGKYLLPPEGSV